MKIFLEKIGIKFDMAKNGLEAVELYKKNRYKFILMDENMPILNGIEATKQIRKFEKDNNLPHTIIIALTADVENKDKFLKVGMDYYLSKPLDIEKLEKIMGEI
jgi:CheY-like chemotaxis protein